VEIGTPKNLRYALIQELCTSHAIRHLCKVLAVHPSGFYAWRLNPESRRTLEDRRILGHIKESWLESGSVYGYRKVSDDLRDLGERCGINRVHRIMRAAGLRSQTGYGKRRYQFLQINPNPARHAIFGALKQQRYFKDKAMATLSTAEIDRFMAALPYSTIPAEWRRRRDRAIQLTMLFAGLRVSEVLGLLVDEISLQAELDGSHKIHLTPQQKHSTSHEHTTILRAPAVKDVLSWIEERGQLAIPGNLAFPSPSGKRLDASSVYLQVKATLASAKINITRSGGRTLRNTYAVQEIALGTEKATLSKQLGLALERSTQTYIDAGG